MSDFHQAVSTLWQNLPQPIIGLAPMDGVTDSAFRHIVARFGKPDVLFTEFINVLDICSGRQKAVDGLRYTTLERPIIAQIYGKDPWLFYQAAHVICELGFDGLDINMGCPSKNVSSSGSGAGLIRTPALALDLVAMAKRGIQDWAEGQTLTQIGLQPKALTAFARSNIEQPRCNVQGNRRRIPVSVKTRLGYERNIIQEWSDCLIQARPEVISIHGRTLTQMYRGLSDWEAIAQAARRIRANGILTFGNGDIRTLSEAYQRIQESGVNGILIGRGALGHPWIFQDIRLVRNAIRAGVYLAHTNSVPALHEKFQVMIEHARLFETIYGKEHFPRMRKHLRWYCSNFPHAAVMRSQVVRTHSSQDVTSLVDQYQIDSLASHASKSAAETPIFK